MNNIKAVKKPAAICVGVSIGLSCAGLSSVAVADVSLRGAVYSEYTNNSRRSDDNKESELEYNLEAGVTLEEASRWYEATADYLLTRTYFDRDTFDDRTTSVGFATADLIVLPERFIWQFYHVQDNQVIDSASANVPDNREERSVFQTGPLFSLDVTPVDRVDISGRYIDSSFAESTENDSERNIANVQWTHRYSPIGAVALTASASKVEFENAGLEYDQRSAGLNFTGQLKSGTYLLGYGKSEIERENSIETEGSYLTANLNLNYGLNTFTAAYNRELTDSSIGLSLVTTFDPQQPDTDTNFDVVDILERENAQLMYERSGIVTDGVLGVTVYRQSDDYINRSDQNETRTGVITSLTYSLSPRFSLDFRFAYQEVEPEDNTLIGINKDQDTEVGLTYNLGNLLSIGTRLSYEKRSNDENSLREFNSLSGLVGLYYNFR